jgi:hypothetical protein
MDDSEIVRHWIELVDRTPPGDFRPVRDFLLLPDPPAGDSIAWCKRFFQPEASPHNPRNAARHSYHLANATGIDLLRHEYATGGMQVTVTEGVNFLFVQTPPPDPAQLREKGWPPLIDAAAHALLNMTGPQHCWAFQHPESVTEGTLVSTNPSARITFMAHCTGRADTVIHQGGALFVCYKKRSQNVGFLHGAQWFPEAFRRRHA